MQNKTPLNEPFSSTDDALGENFRLLILQEAFDELTEDEEDKEDKKK